jgi:FAD dependent oxidoreductase
LRGTGTSHHGARDGGARHPPQCRRVRADHRGLPVCPPVPGSGRGLQPADRRASTDTSEEEFQRFLNDFEGFHGLGEGDCLGVPYGILVPKGWINLWVAGGCHSSDTKVHGSIRAQSAAYMMGHAAATAAVRSIRTGEPACDLDTEQLVLALRAAGAYLPQPELSKTMTR